MNLLIALSLCGGLGVAATGGTAGLPTASDWGAFQDPVRLSHRSSGLPAVSASLWDSRVDSVHSFDALSYDVALSLDLSPPSMVAQVELRLRATEMLDEIELHLRGYALDQALVDSVPVTVTREDDRLQLDLSGSPLAAGDTALVRLNYHGPPVAQNGLGLFIQGNVAWTLSDPWGTRNWVACYDEPHDKAVWSLSVRADTSLATLANGNLEMVEDHLDGTWTWHYHHDKPMSSYLLSLVTGRLDIQQDSWQGLPLWWYCYPQHYDEMELATSRVGQMFDSFTTLWGDYPFDSYAMGESPIYGGMGGMEHQTCTTIGSGIIAAGLQYESIVAHELSHMWWGDAVTPVDFRHVWLNEGWATYAEAYFYQHLDQGDEQAFRAYVRQIQQTYLNWDSQFLPIFAPPLNDLFNVSQYEKAASVLHMLRLIMGEEAFHQAQRDWLADHLYGTVDSWEYQAAMEASCGQNLDWFFQQWIYSGGYPSYRTLTQSEDGDASCFVNLTVTQEHQVLENFRMPVPVRILTSATQLDTLLWVESDWQQWNWTLLGEFDTLIFNADDWILCRHQTLGDPGAFRLELVDWRLDDSLGGNSDGDLALGETALLSLQLRNAGGLGTDVQVTVASTDLEVGGAWPEVASWGSGESRWLPTGPVTLANPTNATMRFAPMTLEIATAGDVIQELSWRLPVGDPKMLLAMDSHQDSLLHWIRDDLDSLIIFSDTINPDQEQLPGLLRPDHDALVWLSGASGESLSSAELVWVENTFLNDDAGLLISGQDAIDLLDEEVEWTAIGIRPLSLELDEVLIDGDPILMNGLGALLIGSQGAMNQTSPSSLQCGIDDWECDVLATYRNSGEPAIVRKWVMELNKNVIVAGFGLEAISGMAGTSSRRDWLEALVALLAPTLDLPPRDERTTIPGSFSLGQPHPNPFNPLTRIPFELDRPLNLKLSITDLAGRRVAQLVDDMVPAGAHEAVFDGSRLASGLYLVSLEAEGRSTARKILLLK